MLLPETIESAAAELAAAGAAGETLRLRGGGTKLGWGIPAPAERELSTERLDGLLEHNTGDLTAIVQAGMPLDRLARELADAGQMLALDPPVEHDGGRATLGGVLATADSGPLAHRYGRPRDLVLGLTVALADGTIARAGGKVIKNVAGYDLGKLFCGSFGTLGLILDVSVRLHPRPARRATAVGAASDPDTLGRAARRLAASPLELEALDVAWRGGRGGVLAACAGADPRRRATRAAELLRAEGMEAVDVVEDDRALWARQRAGQRSAKAAIARVATTPSALPAVLRATDEAGGTLVGRATLGLSWIELEPEGVARLRGSVAATLPEAAVVLLDAPAELRGEAWGPPGGSLALMRAIKARFDPARTCNPGVFVGGI